MSLPDGTPICRLTEDELVGVGSACKWPQPDVTIFHSVNLPTIPPDVEARVFQRVCDAWSGCCGIRLRVASGPQGASIVSTGRRIDGPMGILGQSELPCGATAQTQLSQQFDASEQWDETMFGQTVLHEVGHAIGLEHAPLGTGAVMEPVLNRSITAPAAWDVAQAQARYGPPTSGPAPTPPPPTPAPVPVVPPPPDQPAPGQLSLPITQPGNYVVNIFIGPQKISKVLSLKPGQHPIRVTASRR